MSMAAYRRRLSRTIQDRLPDDGAMGQIALQSPALYWLVVVIGTVAYAGLLIAAVSALALLAATSAQAVSAALRGSAIETAAWFALSVAVVGFAVAVAYITARWVGGTDIGGAD